MDGHLQQRRAVAPRNGTQAQAVRARLPTRMRIIRQEARLRRIAGDEH